MKTQDFEIKIITEKFENLLASDRLFVDYFNSFLALPKIKFNFDTGDLEILEEIQEEEETEEANIANNNDEANDVNFKRTQRAKSTERVLIKRSNSALSSTAENVKKKLETQLKSIIKKHDDATATKDERKSAASSKVALSNYKKYTKEAFNHSFKDIELIPITALIEPNERKDPKAAAEAKIPVIDTKYNVKILKKPQSMKWLRERRLTVFLQSKFYSEYKLAKLLSQCKLNMNGTSNVYESTSKSLNFFKVEVDQELSEMKLNPFKAKTELEKLKEYNKKFDSGSNEDADYESRKIRKRKNDQKELDKIIDENNKNKAKLLDEEKKLEAAQMVERYKNIEKKTLFNNERDIYRTVPYKDLHSDILFNEAKHQRQAVDVPVTLVVKIEDKDYVPSNENLQEMAKGIVESVLEDSLHELSGYYSINASNFKAKHTSSVINEPININSNESFCSKTFSVDTENELSIHGDDDDDDDEDLELIFEDESFQLRTSFEKMMKENFVKKDSIDSFRNFLKETEGDLYYRVWVDIENVAMLAGEDEEQRNELKIFKITYNRPEIMKKLSKLKDTHSKKLNQNSSDFWSLEYLTSCVQRSISNEMITYWFPKYLLHLNSNKKQKEDHHQQQQQQQQHNGHILLFREKSLNDFQVKNIEKSITQVQFHTSNYNKIYEMLHYKKPNDIDRDREQHIKELYRARLSNRKTHERLPSQESNYYALTNNSNSDAMSRAVSRFSSYSDNNLMFDTSPPVGHKRPATGYLKPIIKSNKLDKNGIRKEVYLEAISQDHAAGHIFMKYLQSTNKTFAINRFRCLQELIKFRELFYDENFTQETIKKLALEIYSKYIAISASENIDCDKTDRLKIHNFFMPSESNSNYLVPSAAKLTLHNTSERPLYEDTFDIIEEFLSESLYDEWNSFIQTENTHFNQIEIANIERQIKIKSKKIEELRRKGLIRLTQRMSDYYPDDFEYELDPVDAKKSIKFSGVAEAGDYFDIREIIKDKSNLEGFKDYLRQNYALNDFNCWMDIEAFMCIDQSEPEKIDEKARLLKKKYLSRRYLFGPTSPIDEETQNEILEKIGGWKVTLLDRPPNSLIELAKKHIESKLETHWLPKYFKSETYKQKQNSQKTRMRDVVDDVLYLKSKDELGKNKIKNRWLFSSKSIISFRKSLKNQFTVKNFRKYLQQHADEDLGLTSDKLLNNLGFLLDVQDYKDLCQKQSDDITLINKVKHIVDSYVNSPIAPKVQIDISNEQAAKIIDESDFVSPYLFLESSLTVFFSLLPLWLKFDQVRSTKDLRGSDDSSFKKLKDYRNDSLLNFSFDEDKDGSRYKWRYSQYIKVLKTQVLLS